MTGLASWEKSLPDAGAALAAEAARFASFGWMRGTSGNLSLVLSRDPLRLAVTASGLDKGSLTPADVVVVDAAGLAVGGMGVRAVADRAAADSAVADRAAADSAVADRAAADSAVADRAAADSAVAGQAAPDQAAAVRAATGAGGGTVADQAAAGRAAAGRAAAGWEVAGRADHTVAGDGLRPSTGPVSQPPPSAKPSAEAALHARVVRLTGAGAVVHVHTVAAVVAGRRWPRGIGFAGLEMLKGIGVPATGEPVTLPVIANSQDMGELSDRLETAWVPRVPAVVVADHGLYAWGAGLLQARHHTEVIQWLLEATIAIG